MSEETHLNLESQSQEALWEEEAVVSRISLPVSLWTQMCHSSRGYFSPGASKALTTPSHANQYTAFVQL